MMHGYFRQKKRRIFLDVVFVGIFSLCFFLTEVELVYIWYPALLCFVFFTLFTIWDYRKFIKKHRRLQELLTQIDETLEYLPDAKNQIEEDYQQLLQKLYLSHQEYARESREKQFSSQEYVTVWAHQMKTPVTAMKLLLEEGLKENTDKKRGELSCRLFEIGQYVDVLLQYVRIETMHADGRDIIGTNQRKPSKIKGSQMI